MIQADSRYLIDFHEHHTKTCGVCTNLTPAAAVSGQKLTSDHTLQPKLKNWKSTKTHEISCCGGVPQSQGLAPEKL